MDASTGLQKWSFPTGGSVQSSPAVSPDGATVFVGSHDDFLYAVDASTGGEKWRFETGSEVYSSPAVSPDGATVFVGSDDNKL